MKEGFWGFELLVVKIQKHQLSQKAHYEEFERNKTNERIFLCKHDFQHAEQQKRLQIQWEWQTLNGRQSEVTSSKLNAPPALFPRAQLNHVDELRDNSLFLYSRLTAPVDFNLTLHPSRHPDPERLSAASGETTEWLQRLTRGISEPRPCSFLLYFWTNASPNINKSLDLKLPVQSNVLMSLNPSVIKPRL